MPGVECDPLSSFPRPSVTSDLPTGIFIFINLFTLCSVCLLKAGQITAKACQREAQLPVPAQESCVDRHTEHLHLRFP